MDNSCIFALHIVLQMVQYDSFGCLQSTCGGTDMISVIIELE